MRAKLRAAGQPVDDTHTPEGIAADEVAETEVPEDMAMSDEDRDAIMTELKAKNAELIAQQGDSPLILPIVDHQAVASVVGDWTGIPVGRMVKDEIEVVLKLEEHLAKRVIGQDHAMKMIAKRI